MPKIAVPNRFLCQHSKQLMFQPVKTSHGSYYELSILEDWLQTHSTPPDHSDNRFITDPDLKNEIALFRQGYHLCTLDEFWEALTNEQDFTQLAFPETYLNTFYEGDLPLGYALKLACEHADTELLFALLSQGADPNLLLANNRLPTKVALTGGSDEALDLLLEYGADIYLTDKSSNTLFLLAAREGNLEALRKLYAKDKNQLLTANQYGNTALHLSIMNRRHEVFTTLINWEADLGLRNKNGDTAFLVAAIEGHIDMMELMLQRDATVLNHTCPKKGNNALIHAGRHNRLKAMRWLIQQGLEPNFINQEGTPAIVCLATSGNEQSIKVLLDYGAEIDAINTWGDTALILAAFNNKLSAASLLLNHKCAVNSLNKACCSALMFAAKKGFIDMVKLLLQHGADTTLVNANQQTAQDLASSFGHEEIVNILATYPASLKQRQATQKAIATQSMFKQTLQTKKPRGIADNSSDNHLQPLLTKDHIEPSFCCTIL